ACRRGPTACTARRTTPTRCGSRSSPRRLARNLDPPLLGPGGQAAVSLGFVHRTLVETSLEQEVERFPHDPPRLDAEELHDLPAVERGTDRVELLLLAQLG